MLGVMALLSPPPPLGRFFGWGRFDTAGRPPGGEIFPFFPPLIESVLFEASSEPSFAVAGSVLTCWWWEGRGGCMLTFS